VPCVTCLVFIVVFYRQGYNGDMKMLELHPQRFLTVAEVASLVGMTDGRIRQLLRDGKIVGQKISPQLWLIPTSEIEKLKIPPKRGRPRISETHKKIS
jgi:excisionase family DNA binding protein